MSEALDKTEYQEYLLKLKEALEEINLTDHFSEFEYQGFDPLKLAAILNKDPWDSAMIVKCISLYTFRGTNITGMESKSKDALKSFVKVITSAKYGVKAKATSTTSSASSPTTITLGRIASTFPEITATIYAMGGGKVLGTIPSGFPKYLCWPGGVALIPTTDETTYAKWLEWAISFDKVIKTAADHNAESVDKYGRIAYTSTLLSDAERLAARARIETIHLRTQLKGATPGTPSSSPSSAPEQKGGKGKVRFDDNFTIRFDESDPDSFEIYTSREDLKDNYKIMKRDESFLPVMVLYGNDGGIYIETESGSRIFDYNYESYKDFSESEEFLEAKQEYEELQKMKAEKMKERQAARKAKGAGKAPGAKPKGDGQ